MKLIKPSVEIIKEKNPYKKVERIGRMCYKSEDKITFSSCYPFVENLVKRKHFAMLEHARVQYILRGAKAPTYLFNVPGVVVRPFKDNIYESDGWKVNVSLSHLYNPKWVDCKEVFNAFRTMIEDVHFGEGDLYSIFDIPVKFNSDLIREAELVSVIPENQKHIEQFTSIKFICDRGVSHELVRHRCAVAQESTRYCNYSKVKFGGEVVFVEPADFENWDEILKTRFIDHMNTAEFDYIWSIEDRGLKPQQARAFLPNALKTEVVITMHNDQWQHFFNLRSIGTTGAPHPDMKVVADMAYELFKSEVQGYNNQ